MSYEMWKRKYSSGQEFTDLFHLATRAASYERLQKEKKERRTSSKGTYYKDPSIEIAVVEYDSTSESEGEEVCVAELVQGMPYEYPALTKPKEESNRPQKNKNKSMAEVGKVIRHYENGWDLWPTVEGWAVKAWRWSCPFIGWRSNGKEILQVAQFFEPHH